MLDEAPNNNDIMRITNIVLNEVPYSNDATRVGINVFNCSGHTTILNGDYIAIMQKRRLTRDER